jgi:succinylglutamate desuccinylase
MLALGKLLELTLVGHEPSAKTQLTAAGCRLRWLMEGALEVSPAHGCDSGLDLLLSAGMHGNERVPVALLDRLLRRIARNELQPRARLLLLFGNPAAMRRGERFIEQDINRLFNGEHARSSGVEALRACELEHLAAFFFDDGTRQHLHYDLHSQARPSQIEHFALYPWAEGRRQSLRECARLQAAGIAAVLLQRKASCTFSAYSYAQLGAEALTLELGAAAACGHEPSRGLAFLEDYLCALIEGREPAVVGVNALQLFAVSREIIKHSDAFVLHLPADVENFTALPPGYLLAEDLANSRWLVEEPGSRIIFANFKAHKGQGAGILIVPYDASGLG